jgi:hypothetical protein
MKKMMSALLIALALSLQVNAYADTAAELGAAKKIAEIFNQQRDICLFNLRAYSAEDQLKADPNAFLGMTPKSKHWAEIEKALDELRFQTCTTVDTQLAVNYYLLAYRTKLSTTELTEALKFYSSPLGRKIGEIDKNVSANLTQEFWMNGETRRTKAAAKFNQQLEKWLKE